MIVNDGLAEAASLLIGNGTAFSHLAIGSSGTTVSETDSALVDETHRESASTSISTTAVTDDTSVLEATFSFNSNNAIREYGTFNDASAGVMLNRITDDVVNVSSGDSIQLTMEIQHS